MPTIVDELVVKLTLDPKGLSDGQRKALSDFKKTQEGVRKTGAQIEDSAKRAQDAMSALRTEVLAFGAAVIGTTGVANFLSGLASTAQQLGFVSAATGTSVEKLSEWRNAARLAGGTAEGMTALMQHLSGELHTLKVTGNSAIVQWLRPMGINAFEANGQIKETGKLIEEVLNAIQRGKVEKGDAAVFFGGLGADQNTINFLLQGKNAVDAYLEKSSALGVATKELAEDAREANEVWQTFTISLENFGNKTLVDLGRGFKWFHEFLGHIFPSTTIASAVDELKARIHNTGTGPPPPGNGSQPGASPSSSGGTPLGIAAYAASIQSQFPGARITSTTGGQHAGAAHGEGRAFDIVIPNASPEVAGRLRSMLGDSGRLIDETKHPASSFWTGPHYHVDLYKTPTVNPWAGAGSTNTSSSNSHVEIGAVNVYPPSGDPKAIASGIGGALKNTDLVNQANSGQSK